MKGKIMTIWILAGIGVHYLAVFLPALFVLSGLGLSGYLGSRDAEPDPGPHHGRAQRALRNGQENLAPFLGLALLAMVVPGADTGLATTGAAVFVLARAAYLPLYILAVPVVRSLAWTIGFGGLVLIALALL
jgi:uncharacterized MAPEG superfamily protein